MTGSKRAVVVGGATGIGSGIARALVARGYHVHLCDIDTDGAAALAAELGAAVTCHRTDVTSNESIAATEQAIRSAAGTIDLVFANAGAISLKPFVETTDEDWQWLMGINFFGTVKTLRAFLPGLLGQGAPARIVVTSSVAALRDLPLPGQAMYAASKAAQLGTCIALQTELEGTNVALSAIFPGPVRSQLRAKSEAHRAGAIQLEVPAGAHFTGYIDPPAAGERILNMVEAGRRFISTHPAEGPYVRATQDAIFTAFDEGF